MNEPAPQLRRARQTQATVGIVLIAVAAAIVVVYGLYRGAHPSSAAADSGTRIQHWLFTDPTSIPGRLAALTNWMKTDTADPALAAVPYTSLLLDPELEGDRQQAIAALNIP